MAILLGLLIGIILLLFLMPLIPGWVDSLTNEPNRHRPVTQKDENSKSTTPNYPKSVSGFFTYLQPGRVKMIERGNRFIRAIMRYADHAFRGELPDSGLLMQQIEYWNIEVDSIHGGSDPIPFPAKRWSGWRLVRWFLYSPFSILLWAWKEWVYLLTGAVFTGIYPFQWVRTYSIERKKMMHPDGQTTLERIVDYSDHYRVADFQVPIQIPESDTKDKIPVKTLLNAIGRVHNPYLTAYNTDDDWITRLLASVADVVTAYTRSRDLEAVLSATDEVQARELGQKVVEVGNRSAKGFGVTFTEAQVLDISPTHESDREKLGDLAIARVDRQAAQERAVGKAADILEEGKALKEHPEAQAIPQIEGMVRAAEAVGKNGGIVILPGGGGQPINPIDVAILQALRNLGGTPPTSPPPDTST